MSKMVKPVPAISSDRIYREYRLFRSTLRNGSGRADGSYHNNVLMSLARRHKMSMEEIGEHVALGYARKHGVRAEDARRHFEDLKSKREHLHKALPKAHEEFYQWVSERLATLPDVESAREGREVIARYESERAAKWDEIRLKYGV